MSAFSDPTVHLAFSVFENKGVFALLLGSGISRAAEIPTGWEITTELVRRVALLSGVEEQPDWAKWYLETEGFEPNYSQLLAQLAPTADERRSILHSFIEPTKEEFSEGRKTPTKAHRAIADLVRLGFIRVIVTTNFDRLLETALRELGIEPTVISSVDSLKGAEPITHSACYIVKIHGDYKDARILNTDEELQEYPAEFNALLDRIFDEYGLIVCGWSGEWDPALRGAMLRAPNRRYPIYWAARGALSSAAQDLAASRSARTLSITDADSLFISLRNNLETLEQSHRQNPLDVDLLVRTTKRFLASQEHRIQLADLFTDEVERVLLRLDANSLSANVALSDDELRQRITQYEYSTEALAQMAGTLGRWGDEHSFSIAQDSIEALCAVARQDWNGFTDTLELRKYPAVLVFTAYGIGLTRAEKWSLLHKLFSIFAKEILPDRPDRSKELFLDSWPGSKKEIWNKIRNDGKNYRTPFSDHLFEYVFLKWAKSLFGTMYKFEEVFELFEILGSITYLDHTDKKVLEDTLNTEPKYNAYTWVPMGRSFWNHGTSRQILAKIDSDEFADELLAANFARGDKELLKLLVQNVKRLSARLSSRI